MFDVVTGPFHPDLESVLVEEVRQLKSDDPLTPLAIVVPSDLLRRRLQWLFCIEHQCALLDVHFLTFHQLALRLYDEQQTLLNSKDRGPVIELVPDLFFEYLLSQLAARELSSVGSLKLSNLSPGSWAALWATIRDLKEAMVDPTVALQGIGEGLFEPDEAPKLRTLFTLYAAVQETSRALTVGSFDDLASILISLIPHSRFLSRLRRVCYYGFYDLTQVQLSLLEVVARCAPVTLYFPLSHGPAFTFARRFFERHLLRNVSPERVTHTKLVGSVSKTWPTQKLQVQTISTVGPDDEVAVVCKEILMLVETHGYGFAEIGVVARTLEPYQISLRRTFDQHRIPFTTTATASVLQEPVVKAILQLAQLRKTGFYWRTVLDVLNSPFYRMDRYQKTRDEVRPDLWQVAVRSLGITRGEEEWKRLASVTKLDSWVDGYHEPDEDHIESVGIEQAQLRVLSNLVTELIADCQALPVQGSFHELTNAFTVLMGKHLMVPGLIADSSEPSFAAGIFGDLPSIGRVIQGSLESLRQLDRAGDAIRWEEWVSFFVRALEYSTFIIGIDNHAGVQVLDAMAARGLPFRALFVLGLNEKVFPRVVREDAFLRDRHRRILEETLGYKIDEKLTGYEEEQLLFVLLTQAARDRLFLLYQRADTEGRPLATSSYLGEFHQAQLSSGQVQDISMPRRFSDRLTMPLFAPSLLTQEELTLSLVLQGHDPSAFLEMAGRGAELFQNGWEALQKLEGKSQQLGVFDGLIGPIDQYWTQLTERGISPTPLEQYARCPFQYFAAQVLRLQSLRQQELGELPAQAIGKLCHAVLRVGYQRLLNVDWPQRELTPESIRQQMLSAADEVFNTYAAEHGTGFFLTWQLMKEMVIKLATATVESDQNEFRESGFRPVVFEVEAEGLLEGLGSPVPKSFKLRGRLDRIDQRMTEPGFRIIDYKFQQSRQIKNQDRDLLTSGIRGFRLQPPLYALMTRAKHDPHAEDATVDQLQPEHVEFIFLAPHWKSIVEHSRFDASAWGEPVGQKLRHTLQLLLEGVQGGRYFILPDGYCDYCDFSASCRRFHGPTWWRAHSATPAKQLRQLRRQKVISE